MRKALPLGRRQPLRALTIGLTCVFLAVGSASAGVPDKNVRTQIAAPFDQLMAEKMANAAPLNISGTSSNPEVFLDLQHMNADVPAIIQGSRTLVPVRFVSQGLGASVRWDEVFRRVTIRFGDATIVLIVGSPTAFVDGSEMTLDQAPFILGDRVYVPIRFVTEVLGGQVDWVGPYAPACAPGWPGTYQVWIFHPKAFWGGKGLCEREGAGNWFTRG